MSRLLTIVVALLVLAPAASGQSWPDGKELSGRLLDLARLDRARVMELGRSAGDQKLRLLEIAPVAPRPGGEPAVLVLANLEGNLPLASLAATELAAEVLAAPADSPAAKVRWYVLPVANPDGLDRFFERPRTADGRNDTARDDDADGLEGEDPPDDLDGDGLITWMLLEDPAGGWSLTADGLPVEARLPGVLHYRRELEGRDDDGDGRYNEDPPGGVQVARNFPHGFAAWTDRGLWPGDQPESRAILEFAHQHPDIALVLTLGAENNLRTVPAPADPLDLDQAVWPGRRLARALGLTAGAEYPLRTVLDAAGRGNNLTPAAVRARLHLDALTRPPIDDLSWWSGLSQRYRRFLVEHGLDEPRLEPPAPRGGSAAAWAYHHLGTPTVALDLWSLPTPADTSAVDSLAVTDLGPQPEPWLRHLQRRTLQSQHAGWRPWSAIELPDGRRGLVGGPEPGARHTPAAYAAHARARALLPFCLELAGWLPELAIDITVLDEVAPGLHRLIVVVDNPGRLPYPTEMGEVNRRPPPVVVTLDGGEPVVQPRRLTAHALPAAFTWLVRTDKPERLSITATAPSLGTVRIEGGER